MKIAFVASPVTPLRPAQAGGAQAFLSDLAVGFTKRGHAVTVHCAEGSELPGVALSKVPVPSDVDTALVRPGGSPPKPSAGVERAMRAIYETIAAAPADAVSQHAFDAPALELAAGMPVLHTLHLPPIVPAVVEAARRVPASHLATVSLSCQADWGKAGVRVERVIPNGVADLLLELSAPEPIAMVAGRISPEKGVEDAIAAAHRAGLKVVVVGERYDPSYQLDLSGAEYVGPLPREELRRLMARCAVTICAVHWEEPFGMVAAEAQLSGCPVAAYRRGALPEVVSDGTSGILAEPDDVTDLARAVRECLELNRAHVRTSGRLRLGLDAALDRYEAALAAVAY